MLPRIIKPLSDRRLIAALTGVAVLVAINAGLAYANTVRLYDTLGTVSHTHALIAQLERLLTGVVDAENAQRGYLITDDPLDREPYDAAKASIDETLAGIDQLVAEDSVQIARMPELRERVARRIGVMEEGIAARREKSFDLAKQVVMSGRGKETMAEVRATVADMQQVEQRLLAQRTRAAERSRTVAVASSLSAGLLAVLVLAAFARRLHRQMQERAAASHRLQAEMERFRTTLGSIADGVITTDTRARVTFINGVAQALTGWTALEAEGQPLDAVFRIVDEDTGAVVENPALRALREGSAAGLAGHAVLQARDGVGHPIDDSAAPIHAADGSTIGAVLVFRDIAERRGAERALREAGRRKDEFLALLAHELRNPLAPLGNALEIMRVTNDAEQVARVRGVMERQLALMVRLVDDLLDVSRITSNKQDLQREVTAVADVVASALETCEPLLRQSGVRLTQALPQEPLFVEADRIRLAQALFNLLSNACKFSPQGSELFLTVRRDGSQVVISVRDTGIGIPADMLERIFEMFAQVDRRLERTHGGLGIGLTLVRRIVELHGGTVEARSDGEGRGSEFILRLELVPPPQAGPGKPARTARVAGLRILVADDNRDAAETLTILLRLRGHEVRVTHDGRQAVQEVAAFRPAVVLLDIGMPELNGYEAVREIRGQTGGRDLLIVAVTGWGSAEDERRTREAGFDHHLVKPVDLESLEKVLATRARPAS